MRWRENSNFKVYFSTLEVIEEDLQKQQQQKRLTDFQGYANKSLTTHFKIWYEDHIFLVLFVSEQKMAKEVSKVLLGIGKYNFKVYKDKSHVGLIHCSLFHI